MIAPTAIIGALAAVLMNWRSPTHVQLKLTTDHLILHVGGEEPTEILDSLAFRSITVQNYSRFELNPDRGSVADLAALSRSDEVPESAWRPLTLTPPVAILAGSPSLQPSLTLEAADHTAQFAGTLDRMWAKPSTQVVLDVAGSPAPRVSILISGQSTSAFLSLPGPFNLFSNYGQVTGVAGLPAQADSLALRFHLPASSPQAQVIGTTDSLALIVTPAADKQSDLFSSEGIPVEGVDLTRQGSTGNVESTLLATSEIRYPDSPRSGKVVLSTGQFLVLGGLKKFRISEVTLDPGTHALQLTAEGTVGNLRAGTPGFARDCRLTYFDRLWNAPQLVLLFGIVCWVFPTTIAGYKLYKEFVK